MPYLNLDDPMETLKTFIRQVNGKGISWQYLCNAAINYLLRTEDRDNVYRALSCASRQSVVPHTWRWSIPLNNAYLANDDMLEAYSLMVTTVHMRSNRDEDIPLLLKNLHNSVQYQRPDRSADEVIREVLQSLKERHIGLAKEACGALEAAIGGNPENKALLEDLQNLHGEREAHWTDKKKQQGRDSMH